MDARRVGLGLLAVSPALAFGLVAVAFTLHEAFDACTIWSYEGPLSPSAECPSVRAMGESRGAFLLTAGLYQAAIAAAALVAAAGIARWPAVGAAGAWALVLLAVPLGWGGWDYAVVMLSAAFVVATLRVVGGPGGNTRIALRALGALAGLAAAWLLVGSLVAGLPTAALVLGVPPALVAGAAWWPAKPQDVGPA